MYSDPLELSRAVLPAARWLQVHPWKLYLVTRKTPPKLPFPNKNFTILGYIASLLVSLIQIS